MSDTWNGRRVLITGGLGFLGSNLAIRLVELGAQVMLVDSMLPLYGGNLFNIAPVRDRVRVNFSDIRDRHSTNYLVQERDIIFHLAGQVSHVDSVLDPFTDVDININGTLAVLEACRQFNPRAKIIFTGTRGQYGPSTKLPVDEEGLDVAAVEASHATLVACAPAHQFPLGATLSPARRRTSRITCGCSTARPGPS